MKYKLEYNPSSAAPYVLSDKSFYFKNGSENSFDDNYLEIFISHFKHAKQHNSIRPEAPIIETIIFFKSLAEPEYIDIGEILGIEDEESFTGGSGGDGVSNDPLYEEAVEVVLQTKKASASYLQRRLSIGYNRAARLIEEMEAQGIVGPMQGSKPREVFGSAGSSNADDNYF